MRHRIVHEYQCEYIYEFVSFFNVKVCLFFVCVSLYMITEFVCVSEFVNVGVFVHV